MKMNIFKNFILTAIALLATSSTSFSNSSNYNDISGYLNQHPEKLEYLLSYESDVNKNTNIEYEDISDEYIINLYQEAFISLAEKYEYVFLPPLLANKNNKTGKDYTLYEYKSNLNKVGFPAAPKQLLKDIKNKSNHQVNLYLREYSRKYIETNILEAPVGIVMTDVVNIFGEKIGTFRLLNMDSTGISDKEEKYILQMNGSEKITNLYLSDINIIKMDYESFNNKYQICWSCRLIDYSFDAVNYFSYVSQKYLSNFIIAVLFLATIFYMVKTFIVNLLKSTDGKNFNWKEYCKDLGKKVLMVFIALLLIKNLNTTVFQFFARPPILIASSIGNFFTEDAGTSERGCEYFDDKKAREDKMGLQLTQGDSYIYDTETDTNFFKDDSIDLKEEIVCSIYKIMEQKNQLGFLANASYYYGNMNVFLWIAFWLVVIRFSFLIGLEFIDSIFSMGLAVFFAPFAFIMWALDGAGLGLNLSLKQIYESFIKAAVDLISIFMGTYIFISIFSTFFTGSSASIQTMLTDPNYSAAILTNLLEYKNVDFISLIFIFTVGTEAIESGKKLAGELCGSIKILGLSGSDGSDSITGIGSGMKGIIEGGIKKVAKSKKEQFNKKMEKYYK